MRLVIYLVSIIDGHINNKSKKWSAPVLCAYVKHIRQYILIHAINYPHGHIILVYDVWLFSIHSLFFMMLIMFGLLNWLFTGNLLVFSILLALTVPAAATPIVLRCPSKAELVK